MVPRGQRPDFDPEEWDKLLPNLDGVTEWSVILERTKLKPEDWSKFAEALGDASLSDVFIIAGMVEKHLRAAIDKSGVNPILVTKINLAINAAKKIRTCRTWTYGVSLRRELVPTPV